ncbi:MULTISPECIES: hypothetical protein [unclassified Pseudomonas]|uniref:Uncharacterized protein n=1 Tax=Pseudomonas machongensis TaxID=3110229 RepID=A0ABU5VNM8_9PSED|nr:MULTISPECIES: hypothetical protein [unclassified Pseudomonas]MBC3468594.1 hypothetical protein [Pseudomonas sp. RW10S2]MEA5674294.1 hypothetical protein [Pseudomonas sp. MH2]
MNLGIVYPHWSIFGFYDLGASEHGERARIEQIPVGVREIVGWLSDDVSGTASAQALIDRLSACGLQGHAEYLGFGNAHHMGYAEGHLYLECEYSDGLQVIMTVAQATDVLSEYVSFLKSGVRNKDAPPTPFLVEYVAEGEAACLLYQEMGGRIGFSVEEMRENSRAQRKDNKRKALLNKLDHQNKTNDI